MSAVQQLPSHFPLNSFPRCSSIGVFSACVFCMPSTPLITPKNQLEAREGPIHHPQLGPALNLLTRMELFHFPSSPYTPTFPKPTKKSAPLNSTATPRSLTGEANLRGALCFRLKNTLAIHMRLTVWRCGSQKNNNKNKHYEIWSVAWNLILVKCLLSDRMEQGSLANDSSNILKGGPSILKWMDRINNAEPWL